MKRLYTYLAARLVRAIVAWCTARGRFVDYVHQEPLPFPAFENFRDRLYMRRYVLFGYRTGDPPQSGLRACLPNLYLHHMHAPDADDSLHDHPWPWGLSFVLLGGYREERFQGPHPSKNTIEQWMRWTRLDDVAIETTEQWLRAPALNYISGSTFHRVAQLRRTCALCPSGACEKVLRAGGTTGPGMLGTFTLFLAGPRRRNKPWGYLVSGRGYVDQKTRHRELGAREVRP